MNHHEKMKNIKINGNTIVHHGNSVEFSSLQSSLVAVPVSGALISAASADGVSAVELIGSSGPDVTSGSVGVVIGSDSARIVVAGESGR